MSKPRSKAEARWKYWRSSHPWDRADQFSRWAKKQMRKALRRFTKGEVSAAPREPEYDPQEYIPPEAEKEMEDDETRMRLERS